MKLEHHHYHHYQHQWSKQAKIDTIELKKSQDKRSSIQEKMQDLRDVEKLVILALLSHSLKLSVFSECLMMMTIMLPLVKH